MDETTENQSAARQGALAMKNSSCGLLWVGYQICASSFFVVFSCDYIERHCGEEVFLFFGEHISRKLHFLEVLNRL
jgi:hypothetical protein